MIEINNLSKSYGINKIFENESITLTNSCIYALVGVNGIGKSTFLNPDYPTLAHWIKEV